MHISELESLTLLLQYTHDIMIAYERRHREKYVQIVLEFLCYVHVDIWENE